MILCFAMVKKILFYIFIVIAFVAITAWLVIGWSFLVEPNLLTVNNLRIEDKELKGLKIVFVTDFHICADGKERLQKIIDKINVQKADIVLLGGDYIVNDIFDNHTMAAKDIAENILKIKAKYGVFAVLGNHDYSFGAHKTFAKAFKDTHVKLMDNQNCLVNIGEKQLCIVGISDFSSGKNNVEKAFEGATKPAVAFTHSPDIFSSIPSYVNYTFAGHTHGGQVCLPLWGPLARPRHLLGKYVKGCYEENNKRMFVSKGVGTSHLNVRFFAVPEIVVAEFY